MIMDVTGFLVVNCSTKYLNKKNVFWEKESYPNTHE